VRAFCYTALLLTLIATPIQADQLPSNAKKHLADYVKAHDREDLDAVVTSDVVSDYIFERLLDELQPERIELGDLRQDLQLGSLSGRSASTSILARPGISELLSAALESGAVGRKTDDTSVTFSVNALMLRQFLSGQIPRGCGSLDNDCLKGVGRWLRGLSGSMTFDTSKPVTPVPAEGDPTTPVEPAPPAEPATPDEFIFLTGGRKLTAASLRYELLVRERDKATVQKKLDEARAALQVPSAAFLAAQEPLENRLTAIMENKSPETAPSWRDSTLTALQKDGTSLAELEVLLLAHYRVLYERLRSEPEFVALQVEAIPKKIAYIAAQNALLAEKLYRKALTTDYVYERPSQQPELHQIRAIFSTPLGTKPRNPESAAPAPPPGALTINAGVSVFRPDLTTSPKWKVRDSQVSAGLDWTPNRTGVFRPTYTAAYYFQYMVANGVLKFDEKALTPGGAAIELPKAAKELLDTKGAIHIVQFRVSIPVAEGVSFPIAVSHSNRTELIKGRAFWQGHAGVSYDFSGLKKLVGGGK
jgi:hypothetical protein